MTIIRRRLLLVAVAVLLVALAVALLLPRGDGATPGDTVGDVAAQATGDVPLDERTVAPSPAERVGSLVPEVPEQVRLPGTAWLPVRAVGTRSNGVLDVPADVTRLGWWEGGSRVGDPFGSVLVAGHVDSTTQGLGPSAVLLEVDAGQQVVVRTASRTTRYEIRSRELVAREDLEQNPQVYSPAGPARLVLVTCAPPFVASRDGYQNLAVVTAVPTGVGRS